MQVIDLNSTSTIYMGRDNQLSWFNVDIQGTVTPEIDRTPANFNVAVPGQNLNNRTWQLTEFSGIYSGYMPPEWDAWINFGQSQTYIIGTAPFNLVDITNSTEVPVYFGPLASNSLDPINTTQLIPLGTYSVQPTNPPVRPMVPSADEAAVSGGIIGVGGYLFLFGNSGTIRWNGVNPQGLSDFSFWPPTNQATIGNTKIVAAQSTRGGGSVGLLLWTLDSLIRGTLQNIVTETDPGTGATTVTGQVIFTFDQVQSGLSILSANSIVYFNQTTFWVGIDQFYYYNGIVQSLKNTMNANFFFDNLNYDLQEKVWAIVLPRFKEIWWIFPNRNAPGGTTQPDGTPGECNWAVVYNIEDNIWFDTPWNRATGVPPATLPFPIMSDTQQRENQFAPGSSGAPLWFEEYRFDEYAFNQVTPIKSYFQTNLMTMFDDNPSEDYQTRTLRIEPDFVQAGVMTVEVSTQEFVTDSPDNFSQPYEFTPTTGKIDMREMGRLISFRFTSYVAGGNYQMGKPMASLQRGDTRP